MLKKHNSWSNGPITDSTNRDPLAVNERLIRLCAISARTDSNANLFWECNRKVVKLCRKLYLGLPEHSLIVLICTGEGRSSLAPSLRPLRKHDQQPHLKSSILGMRLVDNAKRYGYITLTDRNKLTAN
ncbi:uncharacterized protein DEA37_0001365 [Paragonimus westermani]|uniref:Uncharacterized protein n=1 Tax=Paragonimus westermani TaxID=34504 RepID=A0A5J4NGF0_9TREM|nr:uncharacterized protein DEA37_0001365 [Paragonimus westermani]